MSRLLPFAVLIAILAIVAGCGGSSATATPEPTATATATSVATATSSANPTATASATQSGLVEQGKSLATSATCVACHSNNGAAGVGPTWKGLAGSTVQLADGTSVTADEAYLVESIKDPNAKIVNGFQQGLMPQDFATRLSAEDIDALIAYIESLK